MSLRKILKSVLNVSLVLFSFLYFFAYPLSASDIDNLENEVKQKEQQLKEKEGTLEQIKKEIAAINKSSVSINEKIKLMEAAIAKIERYIKSTSEIISLKEKEIELKQNVLDEEKEKLNSLAIQVYKNSRLGFWDYLFTNKSGDDFLKEFVVKRWTMASYMTKLKLLSQDFAEMKSEKLELEDEKEGLEEEKVDLNKSKSELAAQRASLLAEASKKGSLSSRIGSDISSLKGEISKLQEAILLAKSAGGIISAGDVPGGANNAYSKTGFLANAASGNFAVFAFGAYTHRNGMSQYGAYGRAEAGQTAEQILKAYYPTETLNKNYNVPSKIYVNGTNEYGQTFNCQAYSMDEYLKHLYEMPTGWHMEALKAQVVSARSYAIKYSNAHKECGGPTICPSQSCQVVKKEVNASRWVSAVNATSKWVLQGGAGNFQFSSTSGGYLNTSGWDTTDKKGGNGSWTGNAYEGVNHGNSPWFYKTWPTMLNGSVCNSSKKDSTGNNKYYLSNKEMADIINVWLINNGDALKGSVDYSRIVPVTINDCRISGMSGNPYSKDQLAALLVNPVTSVTSSAASISNGGQTTSVLFGTNRGVISIPGADFRAVYNLRAPGYLQIPPQGSNVTFINIEKK